MRNTSPSPSSTAWRPGVANLGVRPTVGGETLLLEVHLLDVSEDVYGKRLRVRFVRQLREERRFDDVEALRAQIARDVEAAREVFA